MDWRSPNEAGRTPPSGEYVVFHERPFPKRLDRVFRVGAIGAAIIADVAFVSWLYAATGKGPDVTIAIALVTVGLIAAAFAYGLVRAFGLMAVGVVGLLRRKQYVIDWQDEADRPHR